MPGESMPPEPLPAGNVVPEQGPEAASAPGPTLPSFPAPEAPPAGAEQITPPEPAEGSGPAGTQGPVGPADMGMAPLSQPGPSLDPATVTGPPWPRLVAADDAYTPPRLIRWPILLGVLLLAGWIAAVVAVNAAVATSPASASGYVLTASDAHFTATFPVRPRRTARSLGTVPVVAYAAVLPSHAVGVTFASLPASASANLNDAVDGAAASVHGGRVVSRHTLTYLGQPAEDAVIAFSTGLGRIRVVRFGSSVYLLEGLGPTASSFAHDYQVLLNTFTPRP